MENDQNTITELLKNEAFLAWYYKTDPEQVASWENLMDNHSNIKEDVEKAVAFLTAIQIQEPKMPQNKIDTAEQRLLSRLGISFQTEREPVVTVNNQLDFDNTPMSEVKIKLEAVYGIEIVFADATITGEKITCMMPNDNLALFIESLQATMVYQVHRTDNILTISRFSSSQLSPLRDKCS